jgi:AraC family transcriptional regulator
MILQTCPFSNGGDVPQMSGLWKRNVIAIHRATADWVNEHVAPLSIKLVNQGRESYYLGNRKLTVGPEQFLIINEGQSYGSEIRTSEPTISCCVFFGEKFVSDGCASVSLTSEQLLDQGVQAIQQTLVFHQQVYPRSGHVDMLMRDLPDESDKLAFDSWCAQLLSILIHVSRLERKREGSLTATRHATRREIYLRLARAVDVIHQNYSATITLAMLAEASSLSQFHFLRCFKEAFGIPPHQYLTSVRMEQATLMLSRSRHTLSEVAWACGFRDESSFIRTFKRNVGVTPIAYSKLTRG